MTSIKNSIMNWLKKVVRVLFSPVQIALYAGTAVCVLVGLFLGYSSAYVTAATFGLMAVICLLKNIGGESFLLGIYAKFCVVFSILMGIAALMALPRTPDSGDALGYASTIGYVFLGVFPWTLTFKPIALTVIMVSASGLAAMGMELANHDVETSALLLGLFAVATVLHAPARVREES